MKRIAVTGAAGQIAYSLLFSLASGALFPEEPIALHLLELESMRSSLEGVCMELQDGAYPLLQEVIYGSNPEEVFKNVDIAFLVGAKPRGPGMERKDLLKDNASIFQQQGKALNKVAPKAHVLVVGNPANTNCWIALKNAPLMSPKQFFSMMRLDENRARTFLAKHLSLSLGEIERLVVWGNHSTSQVPDLENARVQKESAINKVERDWVEKVWLPTLRERGAAVIKARGKSSAASAAKAAIDTMRSLLFSSNPFSLGVYTRGNPYGIDEDLVFSFPCMAHREHIWDICADFSLTPFLQKELKASQEELQKERDLVETFV